MDAEVRTEEDDGRSGGPPRVLGRYQVVAELGRGSTSVVYLGSVAGPGGFNKLFALKLLRPALAEDPKLVAMFLTEARIGAQLNHPNVVATLEIEEGDGRPFIVMEYLDGEPLQRLIASARLAFMPLPLHMHLAALSGAVEGLGHAHAAVAPDGRPLEIVHRDVSPHNVFITRSGMPKVLDFGFAQTVDSPNTMLSSAGRVAYMSPEQADGDPVDARSDLFSVGVMMWEAATRRRFWSEEASKAEILAALRSRELPSHRENALARCSEEMRSLVLRSTAPDPADRYATAGELQSDLRIVLSRITPPTFALRDLGQRVISLFAADRARLQRAIDEHRENAYASITDDPAERSTSIKAPSGAPSPSSVVPKSSTPRPAVLPSDGASLPPPGAWASASGLGALPPPSMPPSTPRPPAVGPISTRPPGSTRPAPSAPPAVSTLSSEPVPAIARNSGPLPSFPIPSFDEGREGRVPKALLAIAAAAIAGVVLFAAFRGRNGGAESGSSAVAGPSRAPDKVAVPPPPPPPERPHAAAASGSPAEAVEAIPPSSVVRLVEPPAVEISTSPARARHIPSMPAAAWAASRPPAASASTNPSTPGDNGANRGTNAHADGPVQFSEVPPPRPPHPIDSMNPYGP